MATATSIASVAATAFEGVNDVGEFAHDRRTRRRAGGLHHGHLTDAIEAVAHHV